MRSLRKKSTRISLPGNSAFGCRNAPFLHHFSCRNRMPKNTPKHVLRSNQEDCMQSLRKNPPEFRYPGIVHSGAEMHPFCIVFRAGTECSKVLPNMFQCIIRKIGCVRAEKIHPSFATREQCIRLPKWTRFASFFVPEPNAQKHSQTCSSVKLGRLHAFVAKKIHPSFATRQQCIRVPKCTRFASFFMPEPNAQKHSQTCSRV